MADLQRPIITTSRGKANAVTLSAASLAIALLGGTSVLAQDAVGTPLETHGDRLFNFETGNLLPKGALKLWVGSHQTQPGISTAGTGNQIYYGGGEWGVSDRFQLGATFQYFQDPPHSPILGSSPDSQFFTGSLQGKYQLYNDARWAIAAKGSVEYLSFESTLFGTDPGPNKSHLVGSFQLPITYKASDQLQFHFTPGISVFPSDINGNAYYGEVAYAGAGFSWKPNQRWLAYGSVNTPLSGGNTISSTQTITKKAVWNLGARYNVSPKAAVDLFVTNAWGVTPATSILTFFPDGNATMIGATVTYTPGQGAGYRPNYRGITSEPQSARNASLQLDGFSLASADTLSPGTVQISGFYGADDNAGGALIFSPDYDGQVEFVVETPANDGSVPAGIVPNFNARYWIGTKLRLMDQNNGSRFSLSLHPMLGRDTSAGQTGVLYLGMPMSYKANDRATITANPKFAAWGSTELYALGLGLNYQVARGFEAIAEVTPVSDGLDMVWAAGLRYQVPNSTLHLDLHATNAISRYGIGTMVAQDNVKIAFGATMLFNLKR